MRVESLMAEKAMLGLTGAAFPLVLAGGLSLGDLDPSLPLVLGGSAFLGAAGFILPDAILRQRARNRRKSFRYALSAFLDMVSISLAGGGLVQGSMQDAVAVGRGWAFDEFRRPLGATRTTGHPPWEDLGRLGDELGVPELEELPPALRWPGPRERASASRSRPRPSRCASAA